MKILLVANQDSVIYNFRSELVEELLKENKVYILCPKGDLLQDLEQKGAQLIDVSLERHSKGIRSNLTTLRSYNRIINKIKPDFVLTFTIKPNLYAGFICRFKNIPYIPNVTGLGRIMTLSKPFNQILLKIHKMAFKKAKSVFLQNRRDYELFSALGFSDMQLTLLPGSGVNLNRFEYQKYPNNQKITFAMISRVMKQKGIEEYCEAAKIVKEKNPNTTFLIYGKLEDDYKEYIEKFENEQIIEYKGYAKNMAEIYSNINCLVHPSYYYEGLSNVILEAAATGRPAITTDWPGCKDAIIDGVTGLSVPIKDANRLAEKIHYFLSLTNDEKEEMGKNARQHVEYNFNRNIITNEYQSMLLQEEV